MKIISWNVNGIRACYKKGLVGFVESQDPDVFCVQETKAHPDQVGPEITQLARRESVWASAQKKGYSGVATFTKSKCPNQVGLGVEKFDLEGRVVVTHHDDIAIYNIYFPNGQRGDDRLAYKMEFHNYLIEHLSPKIKANEKIIVLGDYNIAPFELDIFDPKKYSQTSGFLPIERDWYLKFYHLGFVDTFRHFYPNEAHRYTWWNQIDRSRLGNRGWRIDMICVSPALVPQLKSADILDQVEGSDHCPVVVTLKSS